MFRGLRFPGQLQMHLSNRINAEINRATPAHATIATSCWGGRCAMTFLLLAITTRRPHKQPSTTLKLHLHYVAGVVARYPQRNKTVVCVCLNANLPYSTAAITCERETTRAARLFTRITRNPQFRSSHKTNRSHPATLPAAASLPQQTAKRKCARAP